MKPRLRSLLWGFMALTLLLAGTTLVCAYDISFSDVPESSWFYEDVMTLSESGVVSGYPDGTYRPTKKVTTGESLKMILLAAGYPEPERVDSHWARGYLNFAIDQGFLVRYQDISDLDVNMTRGMLAKLAANALGLSDPGTYGTFTDTDSVYVEALYAAGIVGGYPDGTYRPDASVSRAEIAAIVNRIYQSLEPAVPAEPKQDPAEITLRTTEQMIDFIKQKEGFQEKAAWDYAQYSIGYGSACGRDDYPNGITAMDCESIYDSPGLRATIRSRHAAASTATKPRHSPVLAWAMALPPCSPGFHTTVCGEPVLPMRITRPSTWSCNSSAASE